MKAYTTYGVRISDRGLGSRRSDGATFSALEIVLLIGAVEYPLTTIQAERLEAAIRDVCLDADGHPRDAHACACMQIADVLAEDLAAGGSPEPIELGLSYVEGLRAYVVDEDDRGLLADLRDAVRRYCDG
jgi:hypothetical protein